jgi:hypothetical protein
VIDLGARLHHYQFVMLVGNKETRRTNEKLSSLGLSRKKTLHCLHLLASNITSVGSGLGYNSYIVLSLFLPSRNLCDRPADMGGVNFRKWKCHVVQIFGLELSMNFNRLFDHENEGYDEPHGRRTAAGNRIAHNSKFGSLSIVSQSNCGASEHPSTKVKPSGG